jgi:asparagine N-glycosylation enzyme membrane subunit Stt3
MGSLKIPLIAIAALALALTLRVANAPLAFANGIPLISPLDELYHWKRITWSTQHFPGVLEFDKDRGVHGAFCPWPPLYDLLAGGAARVLGARAPADVLARSVWFPPLISAVFVMIATTVLAAFGGWRIAIATGSALAASPFLVTQSWIGEIDHHFLEWPLTFAILGATCLAIRASNRRAAVIAGILLGTAITVAMFVQTALLVAAALAFAVLFFSSDGRSSAIAFGIAALAVALYRFTRLPGFPDNQWFLGYTHAALFAGAAVASLLQRRSRLLALASGAAVTLAVPGVLVSIVDGIRFFGGDPWLRTIVEFQPLWKARGQDLLSFVVGLSTGAILVWPLAVRAIRKRQYILGTVAVFTIVHLLLALSSRRFISITVALLALAGGLFAASISRPRLAALALLAIAVPPPIQFALWMQHVEPTIPSHVHPWLRAARVLEGDRRPGRVLAPWTYGHLLDVIGERAVIVDNFGTMPDAITFDRAYDALLARDEETLARYCRESGVRYVIIDNPLPGLTSAVSVLGLDKAAFFRPVAGEHLLITRLAKSTWWWRAYFRRGAAIPGQGMFGRPFRHFRLVYADPEVFAEGTPFRGSAVMIWEYQDRAH